MASTSYTATTSRRILTRVAIGIGVLVVLAVLVWQAVAAGGSPNPENPPPNSLAASVDIAVLVFREGLEWILVLAALTASMVGTESSFRKPVATGAGFAFIATLITWIIVVGLVNQLTDSVPALDLQAATGLLAILVLLVVMNWFFHKVYWTGWISLHTRKKKKLLGGIDAESPIRVRTGLAMLGFTSLYREGFEVVLFLQTYRLKLGTTPVLEGVLFGLALSIIVAILTFVAQRRLPYKKMLVATGVLLGVVLLVMVGEQAQEMQLAHWIPTTVIPSLLEIIPSWMGLWFAIFPTVETLAAQAIAAILVLGSYALARPRVSKRVRAPA